MRVVCFIAVIAALILVQPALALPLQDSQDCNQTADMDRIILGCTRLIELKKLNNQTRAIIYNNRGIAYKAKRDYERAFADLTEAIRLAPKNVGIYVARGVAYYEQGDYDRAIADLSNAVELNPQLEISVYARGAAYAAKGDHDHAIADFNEAARIEPKDPHAYNSRGNSYDAKGDYDRAIADQNEAIRLQSGYAQAFYNRGFSYQNKGEYDRAIADYTEATRIDPKMAIAFNGRGLVHLIKGDIDLAISDFGEAIRVDTKFATAYNNRGSAYFDKADYDRAMVDLNEAIRLDPKPAIASKHRGDIYLITGDYRRALADFNEAIRIDPLFAAAFTARGLTYEKMAETEKARADFNSALGISPKDGNAKLARDRRLAQDIARARLAALSEDPASAPPPVAATTPAMTAVAISKAAVVVGDKRIALVIGNSAYENVPALPNPAHDATLIADVLKRTGFEAVTVETNLRKDALIAALRNFAARAESADWAVVYYAGHGMEVGGVNYLVPTDAKIVADRDIGFEAVPLEHVLNAAERARKLRLVILDACRDNPFANRMKRTMSMASRSVSRGLAAVEPEAGTLVVYSAKDGETAIDGDGSNSPFALAFVKNLQTPGLEVRRLFDYVRDDVMDATGRKQKPFSYGSISGRQDFYFVSGR